VRTVRLHAPSGRARVAAELRRQEAHRPRDRHRLHVLGAELERLDARQRLALQVGRLQLAGDHAQVGDLARRRDLQLQHHLAPQRRIRAQQAVVDGVDRALVALEHEADLLDRARRLAAGGALQGAASTAAGAAGHVFDQRGRAAGEAAAAVAAETGGVDAAAAAGGIAGDQRAPGPAGRQPSAQFPPLEQVQGQIGEMLQQQKAQAFAGELQKWTKIPQSLAATCCKRGARVPRLFFA